MLEYDGTAFSGWQSQPGRRTVQGEVERALREVTGLEHRVHGAGRTDAGAHALGQVASFDLRREMRPDRFRMALNARLPADVVVVSAAEAEPGFHARYSARARRYRYRLLDRPSRPALGRDQCWHVRSRLDAAAMHMAAQALVGEHDWSSFCSASEPVEGRVRNLSEATVRREGDAVEVELLAEGFLRGLARGITGALVEVGTGRREPGWVADVLLSRVRSRARTAPAAGLTLVEVLY